MSAGSAAAPPAALPQLLRHCTGASPAATDGPVRLAAVAATASGQAVAATASGQLAGSPQLQAALTLAAVCTPPRRSRVVRLPSCCRVTGCPAALSSAYAIKYKVGGHTPL